MAEAEALEVIDAVLRSLSEAHSQRLVHRDLKPDNIILQDIAGERIIKVVDFGIAALKGQRITARGEPWYARLYEPRAMRAPGPRRSQ